MGALGPRLLICSRAKNLDAPLFWNLPGQTSWHEPSVLSQVPVLDLLKCLPDNDYNSTID